MAVAKVADALNTFGELNNGDLAKVAGGTGVDTVIETITKTVQSLVTTIQTATQMI
ncbi:MAG: hypothetical protein IJU48_04070 [Synergistaceae bacterium]|nr:hypothetical protein [Synergistaceae bacterium]